MQTRPSSQYERVRRYNPPILPTKAHGDEPTAWLLQHHNATVDPTQGAADYPVRLTEGAKIYKVRLALVGGGG